ncbi:hypothetical protein H1R20_g11136, partial [Candolleomyces eurysporus]
MGLQDRTKTSSVGAQASKTRRRDEYTRYSRRASGGGLPASSSLLCECCLLFCDFAIFRVGNVGKLQSMVFHQVCLFIVFINTAISFVCLGIPAWAFFVPFNNSSKAIFLTITTIRTRSVRAIITGLRPVIVATQMRIRINHTPELSNPDIQVYNTAMGLHLGASFAAIMQYGLSIAMIVFLFC